jgi:hypothetical protein
MASRISRTRKSVQHEKVLGGTDFKREEREEGEDYAKNPIQNALKLRVFFAFFAVFALKLGFEII